MTGRRLAAAMLLAAAGIVGPAIAQKDERAPAADAATTLEQVPTEGPGTRDAAVDVAQPPRAGRAAAVTASEISARADSGTLAAAPLAGDDRCDGANAAADLDLCRHRLETRANQYMRPAPAGVTPEGRLLLLVSPSAPATGDASPGKLSGASGLDGANGPSEQVASALRDQRAALDATATATQTGAAAAALPQGAPTIVVLPGK